MATYFSRSVLELNNPNDNEMISKDLVKLYKDATCEFVITVGKCLRLSQGTISTALVYCQRLYACKSITHARFATTIASLWLAIQVEQTHLPLNKIIHVCYYIKNKRDPTKMRYLSKTSYYNRIVQVVLHVQMEIYHACCRCLKYEHPYVYAFAHLRNFKVQKKITEHQYKDLYIVTNNLINDSFRTQLCIQYHPEKIAVSLVLFAGHLLDIVLDSTLMFKMARMNKCIEDDIRSQFLEQFENEYFLEEEEEEEGIQDVVENKIDKNQDEKQNGDNDELKDFYNTSPIDFDESEKEEVILEDEKSDGNDDGNDDEYMTITTTSDSSVINEMDKDSKRSTKNNMTMIDCFQEIFGLDNNKETDSDDDNY